MDIPTYFHDLGDGFGIEWLPVISVEEVNGVRLPHVLELELEVEDNRLVCVSFTAHRRANGPPVTADTLKMMPVVGAMNAAAVASEYLGLVRVKPDGTDVRVRKLDFDELPELTRTSLAYRTALFLGMSPTSYVATILNVSRDVAAKRVQAARRAGLLEPTTRGKKGA